MTEKIKNFNKELIYLGKRRLYFSGSAKYIGIPRAVLKEIGSLENNKQEADIWYDSDKKQMVVQF